jgi:ComF family protein
VPLPRWASDLRAGLLDLLFAPVCVGCHSPISTRERERVVCRTCWARSRPIPSPRCDRCFAPCVVAPGVEPRCTECADLPPAVRVVRSAYVMDGPVRDLVYALKYRGWEAAARPMAARMAALPFPLDVEEEVQRVVPVPLSGVRLRERGYNQAALLARAVAERKGWSCEPGMLVRSRATETQTNLHPAERKANVAGAFAVPSGHRVRASGEHILLVDDVWTTGATATACAEALLQAGARVVSVLTFARALPDLDR